MSTPRGKVHFNEFGTSHFGRSGKQSEHIMQALHEDDGKGPGTPWVLGTRHCVDQVNTMYRGPHRWDPHLRKPRPTVRYDRRHPRPNYITGKLSSASRTGSNNSRISSGPQKSEQSELTQCTGVPTGGTRTRNTTQSTSPDIRTPGLAVPA